MAYTDDYVKTNWANKPATNTPINQTNLNHMEQGIKNNCGRVANLSTTKAEQSDLLVSFKNVTFDSTTGTFTFTKFDNTTITVNTDLEKLAVNFDYDDDPTSPHYQNLVITLSDGTIKYADLSALVTQYEFTNTSTISFTIGTGGVITANVIDGSITADKLQPNFLADCQAAKTDAENAANSAESDALVAEGYAKGTQNGQPVGPESPYHENNAEYFKNQAAAIVGPKVTSFNGRENIVVPQKGDYNSAKIEIDPSTTSLPNTLDTLQDYLEYMYPPGVSVTLTLNGAKNDVITIKDSNDQTVATCTFDTGQTSGSVQLTVPVGGASFKFVSSKAKGITSETLSSDYEKTVALTDAVSQTVNVYPKNALYWYGKYIVGFTRESIQPNLSKTDLTNALEIHWTTSSIGSGAYYTDNPIDLSAYSKIKMNCIGISGTIRWFGEIASPNANSNNPTAIDASNTTVGIKELDISSITTSNYVGMLLGGSTDNTAYITVSALWLDDGHEDDLTIHGAKEDTITITDSQNQTVATCVFESGKTYGYVAKALLPSGTYKFTSSVANYEKTITLNGSESEVKVMPDVFYMGYWYGNNVGDLIKGSESYPQSSVTFNTNSVTIKTGTSSDIVSLTERSAIVKPDNGWSGKIVKTIYKNNTSTSAQTCFAPSGTPTLNNGGVRYSGSSGVDENNVYSGYLNDDIYIRCIVVNEVAQTDICALYVE